MDDDRTKTSQATLFLQGISTKNFGTQGVYARYKKFFIIFILLRKTENLKNFVRHTQDVFFLVWALLVRADQFDNESDRGYHF